MKKEKKKERKGEARMGGKSSPFFKGERLQLSAQKVKVTRAPAISVLHIKVICTDCH